MDNLIPNTTCYYHTNPLNLSVLKVPQSSKLIGMEFRVTNNYILFYHSQKRENLAMYSCPVDHSRLLANLEIYQWRHHTQFPIVKTRFIDIHQTMSSTPHYVNLKVYIEYCPIKLSHLYEIKLGQGLYLLKQCMIGFQRLFSRFGAFEILDSMISISEKGYCRVWMNQNFSINACHKSEATEATMVAKIIRLISLHSNQSKGFKKIFLALQGCKTFLNALKIIEKSVAQTRILVPNKFIFFNEQKGYPKSAIQIMHHHKETLQQSLSSVRLSIRSTKPIEKQIAYTSKQNLLQNPRNLSPALIKRFKSEDKIQQYGGMKTSEGDTTHSRNIKSSNLGGQVCSSTPEVLKNESVCDNSLPKIKSKKWIEESSFIMGTQEGNTSSKANKKDKKQLSYSQAFKTAEIKPLKKFQLDRKYSANVTNYNARTFQPRKNETEKKIELQSIYGLEFHKILEDDNNSIICTSKIAHFGQDEDLKFKEQHLDTIIKNNGWNMSPDLWMSGPRQLDASFHEGEDDNRYLKNNARLDKLDKIGRRQVTMSILPEQIGDYY